MAHIERPLLALLMIVASWPLDASNQAPRKQAKTDFDVRVPQDAASFRMRAPSPSQHAAADTLASDHPGVTLRWNRMSASPQWLAARPGRALSAPSSRDPEAAARGFLREQAALLGLQTDEIDELQLTSTVPAPDGGTHLYFTQRTRGLEVYRGRVNVTLRADGAVRHLGSQLYAGIDVGASPTVTAVEAVRIATRNVYPDRLVVGRVEQGPDPARSDRKTVFAEPEFGRSPEARLMLFPERQGCRLVWEVRVAEPTLETDYLLLVDAQEGTILARRNRTRYASCSVLLATHPDPETEEYEPAQYRLVEIPGATPGSPQGWFGGDDTTLAGNNAVSHLVSRYQPGLSSPTGVYDYPFNTRESALVNAWYWVNDAHDRYWAVGFDEAAGNFQQDNFGNGGAGGDPVHVIASTTGSYFVPTADGWPPEMGLGWLHGCRYCADHDGFPANGGDRSFGFMRDVVFHEYTHGVGVRRVGGPADSFCLGGSGFDWSDVLPASFFGEPGFGDYMRVGRGAERDLRHDLRLGDPGFGVELLIWGGTLWDMRQSMIALDPVDGLDEFHRLVVESMASVPCSPTLLDGRDATLAADTILFGSVHHAAIWGAFAARGMGELASAAGPTPDFTVPAPHACAPPPTPSAPVAVVEAGNGIRLDYNATGAESVEVWREDLDNPADAAERIAFTTNLSTHLDDTAQGGKSYRYHLVALGGGGIVCRSAETAPVDATASGPCSEEFPLFVPGLTVTDGDPNCAVTLSWNPATEACPGSGAPIVYNVYREGTPGFEPSDRLLVGRTASTSFVDTPVEKVTGSSWFDLAPYYLVLAQHGTIDDPPDHRDRGSSQVMDWEPGLPTLGRTTTHFWDFDGGTQGWTSEDGEDFPDNRWVLVDPDPTWLGGALLAPDEAAGGTGMAWVTGDAGGGPSNVGSHTCREGPTLASPVWDATDGSTILSFDYWAHPDGIEFTSGMWIALRNGLTGLSVVDFSLLTTQRFDGPGRYGWQRAELDVARWITPTDSMQVLFAGRECSELFVVTGGGMGLEEYGIDNVRIESATACAVSDLRLDGMMVDDSAPGWGNANGVLEPGEIVRLTPELLNDGGATAVSPTVSLSSRAPGAFVLDGQASFPDIGPSATAAATDDLVVALPVAAGCNGTVVFELVFTDASGERSTAVWNPEWGNLVTDALFQDDFESDRGWVVSGASGPFTGEWQRGDPVGTFDGGIPANPEDDSPNDAGSQCYVTGLSGGGSPAKDDVDPAADAILTSPLIAVGGYRRVDSSLDYWSYNSAPGIDRVTLVVTLDGGEFLSGQAFTGSQGAWQSFSWPVFFDQLAPVGSVRMSLTASDVDPDDIAESGVDNVLIQGERQVCDPAGVAPPNPVGDSLSVDRSAMTVDLAWTPPAVDGSHDEAVFYKVYVSGTAGGGFDVEHTTMTPGTSRPLDSLTEYYVVSAANAGGTSGEDPLP